MESIYMLRENLNIEGLEHIIHIITVNEKPKGGWYRQIGVIEGMVERSGNRWYDYWRNKKWNTHKSRNRFSRVYKEDLETQKEIKSNYIKKYGEEKGRELIEACFPVPKEVKHKSVYDFFDYIGYNYKDRKMSNLDTMILIEKRT